MGNVLRFEAKRHFSNKSPPQLAARGFQPKIQPYKVLRYCSLLLVPGLLLSAVAYTVLQSGIPLPYLGLTGSSVQFHKTFSVCNSAARIDCVVDGDTIYLGGEKIRISDINTPEISNAACDHERALAHKAKHRLVQLLNVGPAELRRTETRDRDVYGRLLRSIYRDDRSLGDTLVAEGLAHRWQGYKESWCN